MANADPPPRSEQPLTRTGLRKIAEDLEISLPLKRIDELIAVGALPDPNETPWVTSEVVPRLKRFHGLLSEGTSRARRVVQLHIEHFPVEPKKLRQAMAAMLPTIDAPIRKMHAIERADRWFSGLPAHKSPGLDSGPRLPTDWRLPPKSEWADVLLNEDIDRFWSRLGAKDYYAFLLESIATGKNAPHALTGIPKVERLTLMMVSDLAISQARRKQVLETETAGQPANH